MKKNYKKSTLAILITSTMAVSLSSISTTAHSQFVYKRQTQDGKVIYSDHIPPNTKERYDAYSVKNFSLQKITDRELSEAEYASVAEERKNAEQKAKEEAAQKRKDEALLGTYNSVDDIDRIKKFELGQLDNSIKNDLEMLARLKDTNSVLESQISPNSNPVNNRLLSDKIARNQKDINVINENIDRNRKLYVEKERKFDQEKVRFEDVTKNILAKESNKETKKENKKE